jgi:hypothetical protein
MADPTGERALLLKRALLQLAVLHEMQSLFADPIAFLHPPIPKTATSTATTTTNTAGQTIIGLARLKLLDFPAVAAHRARVEPALDRFLAAFPHLAALYWRASCGRDLAKRAINGMCELFVSVGVYVCMHKWEC